MMAGNITTPPDDVDMMAVAKKMHWVTSSIVGVVFVLVGIAGNILSFLIWSRKSMRSSTGTYLIFQAIADMMLLIFFIITDSIIQIEPTISHQYAYGVFFSYIGYPLFFLFVIISIWMLVGVTTDRYIQVCWPHKAKDYCSQRRVYLGAGIICLLCFLINIPHFNTFQPLTSSEVGDNKKAYGFTTFGAGKGSKNYEFWVHCMFLVLAPWLSIFTLNILILRRVIESNRKTKMNKEKTRKAENQLTRLLLTVTFAFLILIIFQCITQCFFMLEPTTVDYRMVNEAYSVAKLGVVINSSINFFLYCLSGKKFRKELLRLLGCRKTDIRMSTSSTSGGTMSSHL